MTKAKITELEKNIEKYDRLIKRNPGSSNSYHLKAEALVEIGKLKGNDQEYYTQALKCYNTAIEIDPENALYVADRMKLHVTMGKPELAVEDMRKIKELPEGDGGVLDLYMENTMQDIASLDEIQDTIKELQISGKIDAKLAGILEKHARVTANLVVQVGAHGKTLSIHDQDIANLKAIVADLLQGKNISEAQIALLEQKTEGLKSEVSHNSAKIQGIEEKVLKTEAKVGELEDDSAMHEDMIIGMKEDLDMLKPVTAALHEKVRSNSSLSDQAKQEMHGMVSHLEESVKKLADKGENQEGIMSKVISRVQALTEQNDFTQQMLTDLCVDIDGIKESLPGSSHAEGFVLIGDVHETSAEF